MAMNISFASLFLASLIILSLPRSSIGVPLEELERAISVLRVRGRALFANAIITSDLLFDLLSVDSLTLFGPTDSMLFDLDMTHSLPFYVSTLRLHSVPVRLPLSDLRSLPNETSLPTLLPSHRLLVTKLPSSNDSIYLDGVHVLLPGLFYSRHLAIHGLSDLLPLRSTPSPHIPVASPPVIHSPAESPWLVAPRFSPAPEPYVAFFDPTPADSPTLEQVLAESPTVEQVLAESPTVEQVSAESPMAEQVSAESPMVEQVPPSPSVEELIAADEGDPFDEIINGFE